MLKFLQSIHVSWIFKTTVLLFRSLIYIFIGIIVANTVSAIDLPKSGSGAKAEILAPCQACKTLVNSFVLVGFHSHSQPIVCYSF